MEKEGEPRRMRRVRKPHCQPLVLVALAPAAEAEAQIGETLHPGNKSVQIFTLTKNAVVDIYVYDGIYRVVFLTGSARKVLKMAKSLTKK